MSVGTNPGDGQLEGARTGTVPRYYGKYPAIVVDSEPDGDAPHRGDLLVAVPAILEDAPPGSAPDADAFGLEASEGRRPIQVLAKPCFAPGTFLLPEPGQHVWVEFAAGDVNEPIWSGVWLPRDTTPATSDDEPPTSAQRVIRTTSGHVIEFDDREGEERLVVRDRNDSRVVFDEDGIRVHSDGDVEVHAANVTVDCGDGEVHLRATNVTVDCDRMSVNGELEVSSGAWSTTIRGNEIRGG